MTQTHLEIIKKAIDMLQSSYISNPHIDAKVIFKHTFNKTNEELLKNPDFLFSSMQIMEYYELIKRRCDREPVAYLIGKKAFWNSEFAVNKYTLIPRPDSEAVINAVLKYYLDKDSRLRVLELGSGSGCLVLSILQEYNNATAVAVDKSEEAIEITNKNSVSLNLQNKCKVIKSDWFESVEGKYNLIISNPPYIKIVDYEDLERDVKFEPRSALLAGEGGLDCYKEILSHVGNYLEDQGKIILEIGKDMEESVVDIAKSHNLKLVSIEKDLSGINRCLVFEL